MPDDISIARVLAALDRAAHYRRSLVNDQWANPASLVNEMHSRREQEPTT